MTHEELLLTFKAFSPKDQRDFLNLVEIHAREGACHPSDLPEILRQHLKPESGVYHPAGEVTAFDEETGLPIVRRWKR